MSFASILRTIVEECGGGVGAALMGTDGIPIDQYGEVIVAHWPEHAVDLGAKQVDQVHVTLAHVTPVHEDRRQFYPQDRNVHRKPFTGDRHARSRSPP